MASKYRYVLNDEEEVMFKVKCRPSLLQRLATKSAIYGSLGLSMIVASTLGSNFHSVVQEAKFQYAEYKLNKQLDVIIREEGRDKFDLTKLSDVDISTKFVSVDVFISPELTAYSFNQREIFNIVKDFYSKHNIELSFNLISEGQRNRELDRTKEISVEILSKTDWFLRNFEVAQIEDDDEQDWFVWHNISTAGIAWINENKTLIVADPHFGLTQLGEMFQNDDYNKPNHTCASTIIHEIGHLFTLSHSHMYSNDPVEDHLPSGKPNIMSYCNEKLDKKNLYGGDLIDFQTKLMHSYLSKGRIYDVFKLVDFDFHVASSLLAYANDFEVLGKSDCDDHDSLEINFDNNNITNHNPAE